MLIQLYYPPRGYENCAAVCQEGEVSMSRLTTLTLRVLLCSVPLVSFAQYRSSSHPDDDNSDGAISRNEWRGDARTFRELDRNRDGVLSGNEVPGSARRERRNNERSYGQRSRDDAGGRADRLDKNESGVVEGYEWPYNRAVFHRLDRNRDSVLSPDELDNIDATTLTELDRNRDGTVDSKEWPGGFAKFERLDNDRNGRVSADEYFERGGEWRRRQRFDAWDTNRDGIIQSTEWKSDAKLFHRLDTDRDSTVTWDEFRSDTERYLRPPESLR